MSALSISSHDVILNPANQSSKIALWSPSTSPLPVHLAVADGQDVMGLNELDPAVETLWHKAIEPKYLVQVRQHEYPKVAAHSGGEPLESAQRKFTEIQNTQLRSLVQRYQPVEVNTSAPVGIWEGEIEHVDVESRTFAARLKPLYGANTMVAGDLSFDQLNHEDLCLVVNGAVFYLEQFSRTRKRQVSVVQEIRFRRLPAWTAAALQRVKNVADELEGIDELPPLAN